MFINQEEENKDFKSENNEFKKLSTAVEIKQRTSVKDNDSFGSDDDYQYKDGDNEKNSYQKWSSNHSLFHDQVP